MHASYDPRLSIEGTGPTVVLVPGMDGTGQLFYRQVPLLATKYRVVTYALRDTTSEMPILVADLARIVRMVTAADERAIVIGESFGGTLALSFALAHPEMVDALVIVNSFPYFGPQFRLHLAWFGLRLLPVGAMALIRRLTAFRLHSRHTHRDDIRRFMALTRGASRDGYLNRLRILQQYDVRTRLGEIAVPVLYLAAELDHLVPSVRQGRYMAERTPRGTLRVLEGHGHICLIAPDLDLAALLEGWRPAAG